MINSIRLSDIDKKFKRYHGWSGADGIYTYNYNGEILMYFSDTFIGDSNDLDERLTFDLINNSLAISDIKLNNINFIYPNNPLKSVFIPKQGYYWLEDGIIENNKLYIYALRMYNDIFSNKIFEIKAIDLIELDLPFYNKINYKTYEISNYEIDNIVLGIALIKEGEYYLIFGYINDGYNKKLILARTKSLINKEYEYLNKDGVFSKSKDNLMILKENFAAESKIIKIKDKFYMAYTKNSIGKDIYLLVIDDLFKPYDKEIYLYECLEHQGNIICYNSKIQSALSNEEELIITYNVNTLVNEEHKNLDIYRPRFIKVKLEDINDEIKKCY